MSSSWCVLFLTAILDRGLRIYFIFYRHIYLLFPYFGGDFYFPFFFYFTFPFEPLFTFYIWTFFYLSNCFFIFFYSIAVVFWNSSKFCHKLWYLTRLFQKFLQLGEECLLYQPQKIYWDFTESKLRSHCHKTLSWTQEFCKNLSKRQVCTNIFYHGFWGFR